MQEPQKPKQQRDWVGDMEVAGGDLLATVKRLIEQGNVRRLIIRSANNELLMQAPLTPALAVVALATIMAPMLVALGAITALIARIKIEIALVEADDDAQIIDMPGDDRDDTGSPQE